MRAAPAGRDIIGLFRVQRIRTAHRAGSLPPRRRFRAGHGRRVLHPAALRLSMRAAPAGRDIIGILRVQRRARARLHRPRDREIRGERAVRARRSAHRERTGSRFGSAIRRLRARHARHGERHRKAIVAVTGIGRDREHLRRRVRLVHEQLAIHDQRLALARLRARAASRHTLHVNVAEVHVYQPLADALRVFGLGLPRVAHRLLAAALEIAVEDFVRLNGFQRHDHAHRQPVVRRFAHRQAARIVFRGSHIVRHVVRRVRPRRNRRASSEEIDQPAALSERQRRARQNRERQRRRQRGAPRNFPLHRLSSLHSVHFVQRSLHARRKRIRHAPERVLPSGFLHRSASLRTRFFPCSTRHFTAPRGIRSARAISS